MRSAWTECVSLRLLLHAVFVHVINLLSCMIFCIDEYLRVLTFHVHLGMMEVAQHLGDAVSAEMFQMVRVSTVRQVVEHYQEVSMYVLVLWCSEIHEKHCILYGI